MYDGRENYDEESLLAFEGGSVQTSRVAHVVSTSRT